MGKIYFKVLTQNMMSVGLLGAHPLQYKLNDWVRPLEPLSCHPRKGGGLWVVEKLSQAKHMRKYLKLKHKMAARIFRCKIGKVIYKSSCRVKTDKVLLIEETA